MNNSFYINYNRERNALCCKVMQELYHKINIWKEKTSYMQADGFHFERVELKKCDTDYCEMDIYVPVCSRSRENRK